MSSVKELWEKAGTQLPAKVGAEQHPADADYLPPVSTVKLPSRGLVYPPDSPLYMLESVDVKPVTAKEENILSSPILIKKGTVLTTLMKACITNRLLDPDAMLVGDRNAILVAIRVSAYGPSYSARVTCPKCGEDQDAEFNLSKLGLKTLDEEPVGGPGNNRFAYKLPITGKTVQFRLLDASLVNRMEDEVESIMKATGEEQGVTVRLNTQVIEMEGVEPGRLARTLAALPARDSKSLRHHMDEVAPGVDMVQEFQCDSCGKKSEVEIPIGSEFFWPSEE